MLAIDRRTGANLAGETAEIHPHTAATPGNEIRFAKRQIARRADIETAIDLHAGGIGLSSLRNEPRRHRHDDIRLCVKSAVTGDGIALEATYGFLATGGNLFRAVERVWGKLTCICCLDCHARNV